MGLGSTHLLILFGMIVLLFGRNKISELMGDVAKGIKSFKNNLAEDEHQMGNLMRDTPPTREGARTNQIV